MPKSKASTGQIDRYLAQVPAKQRAALERVRKIILSAAPGAEECISYQLPAFRLNGRALAAFGAAKAHCSLFPMSGEIVARFADELEGFETSKGTIRFTPEKPIPAGLVKKIVQARIADIELNAEKSRPTSSAKKAGGARGRRK